MLEDIFSFLQKNMNEMKDQTTKLMNNEYFKNFGSHNNNVKFAVDLITVTTSWHNNVEHIIKWLTNVNDYGEYRMQLRLHSFISGITLYEKDKTVNHLCLEIVFKVVNHFKDVSISHLCLLFYKLARETDPFMQKTCLLTLPKLAVRKVIILFFFLSV